MRTHAGRRAGFTLVEVVVVVSLIAVLAALAAGAFFRIQAGQNRSNAETSLNKIHSVMQTKWKVVIDDARKTVPDCLVQACGNDRDRALAVWTYAKLKNELPETPEEAVADVTFTGILDPTTGMALKLSARRSFQKVAADCVTSRSGGPTVPYETTDPEKGLTNLEATARQAARESGALLLVAISQTGGGGNTQGQDGLGGQIATPGQGTKSLQYYKDSWDRPVAFIRHAFTAEVDVGDAGTGTPPPGTVFTQVSANIPGALRPVRTSLDPGGKLHLGTTWAAGAARPVILAALNANRPAGPGRAAQVNAAFDAPFPLTLANRNSVPTLVSAGPNKDFGDYYGGDDDGADNILSFRLRREGARGD